MVTTVPRDPAVPGDPTYHAMRRAIAEGALPFTCQVRTMRSRSKVATRSASSSPTSSRRTGRPSTGCSSRSAAGRSRRRCRSSPRGGRSARRRRAPPRIHAVQSRNVQPLVSLPARCRISGAAARDRGGCSRARRTPAAWRDLADRLREVVAEPRPRRAAGVPRHRQVHAPGMVNGAAKVAGGIVDDETYDWSPSCARCCGPAASRSWPTSDPHPRQRDGARCNRGRRRPDRHRRPCRTHDPARRRRDGSRERVGLLFTGVRRTPADGEPR